MVVSFLLRLFFCTAVGQRFSVNEISSHTVCVCALVSPQASVVLQFITASWIIKEGWLISQGKGGHRLL